MNVLVVPDKFKGTLTAHVAAELIAHGWKGVRPEDRLELLPMSDGGDGFGEVMAGLLRMDGHTIATVDAAHQPREARWWCDASGRLAVVESAQVIGLALLPPKRFHPFDLDTFGLGVVVRAAWGCGAERTLIGIGGSATNDGGFGLARGLGWRFFNEAGEQIERLTQLATLARIAPPPKDIAQGREITVAVDVQNPLLGPIGASRVYGPQKGLREEDFAHAESCLGRLAEVVERDLGMPGSASEPGAGAAGGLGFGLRCFLNARLESGFQVFARYARLEERISAAGLVITAEGAIDGSTLMGKGVGEVARMCCEHVVPCLGLAGTLGELPGAATAQSPSEGGRKATPPNPFAGVYGIVPQLTTAEEAKAHPEVWLPRLAAQAARDW